MMKTFNTTNQCILIFLRTTVHLRIQGYFPLKETLKKRMKYIIYKINVQYTRQNMFVKHVPPLWAYFIEATK